MTAKTIVFKILSYLKYILGQIGEASNTTFMSFRFTILPNQSMFEYPMNPVHIKVSLAIKND